MGMEEPNKALSRRDTHAAARVQVERSDPGQRAGAGRFLGLVVRSLPGDEPDPRSAGKDFKVCKVNVDTNQELASHHGISSIPALLIFKNGKVASRHVGVTPEATLRAEMQRLSQP
jgi:hypothetical protein